MILQAFAVVCIIVTVICWPFLLRYMIGETRTYKRLYGHERSPWWSFIGAGLVVWIFGVSANRWLGSLGVNWWLRQLVLLPICFIAGWHVGHRRRRRVLDQ